MDLTPIKESLRNARLIVAARGMVNYIPNHSKVALSNSIADYSATQYIFHVEQSLYSESYCLRVIRVSS